MNFYGSVIVSGLDTHYASFIWYVSVLFFCMIIFYIPLVLK